MIIKKEKTVRVQKREKYDMAAGHYSPKMSVLEVLVSDMANWLAQALHTS